MHATGTIDYYGPRDFRITMRHHDGSILLDASRYWAGVRVFEQGKPLSPSLAELITRDISRALDVPENLDRLAADNGQMVLSMERLGRQRDDWYFDRATGQLVRAELGITFRDRLSVAYRGNAGHGPMEISLLRVTPAFDIRYDLTLNFEP